MKQQQEIVRGEYMKYVTFYWDILGGIHDLVIHNDKTTATEFFKKNYKSYFQLGYKTNIKLPMSFGYPHRKFIGISLRTFNKNFAKND